jgi:dolichyl-diphosphooligosaccharide--protein glycosyltransferase
MSWWDYGHWITALGENIPNANPFQQNANDAARYLLTQNETQSEQVLNDIDEDDAHTRYVMVDWKMVQAESLNPVRGKFFAPPTFVDGVSRSTYFTRVLATDQLRQAGLFRSTLAIRHKQAYYNSTMVRLYLYHGSAKSPEPYVVDWQGQERPIGNGETFVSPPRQGPPVKVFGNMSAARSFAENDDTATVGGFGPHPSERVPALKHYRLVHMSEVSALDGGGEVAAFRRAVQQSGLGRQLQTQLGEDVQGGQLQQEAIQRLYPNTPAWTKTFERVDGATIEGTAPENASLRIRVQLNPENGVPFVYSQRVQADENGEFSTTVPYSTTGYDEVGPEEGYTDTNVRATGPYVVTSAPRLNTTGSIVRYTGTVNVTERQVVGADDSPATVELESRQVGQIQNPNSDGNGDGGGESGGQSLTAPGRNGVEAAEP